MSSLWSTTLRSPVRGLSLAREAELLLVRDENLTLSLLNSQGELQGSVRLVAPAAGCIADDGSAIASAGLTGQVWWLALDLTVRWERKVPAPALAAALDPFGQYLVVADKKGELHLFDRMGQLLGVFQSPRPIHHVAFVPMTTQLVAAADFGWCGCLELATGEWAWSERPVSHIGSLAVAGGGDPLLTACFSDGIHRYGPGGAHRGAVRLPSPCGQVALSFSGEIGAAAGTGREVFAFDKDGKVTFTLELEHAPTALTLSALGDRLICGFANGTVSMIEFVPPATATN